VISVYSVDKSFGKFTNERNIRLDITETLMLYLVKRDFLRRSRFIKALSEQLITLLYIEAP